MTFKIKTSRNFNNSGKVYTAPVVARKLNGYMVSNPDGNTTFICFDDIDVISISDDEKNMPIAW